MSTTTRSFYRKLWQVICSEKGVFFSDSYKQTHTYEELKNNVLICFEKFHQHNQARIAVLCGKTFLNYSSIIGILFSENIWVPLSNAVPDQRNTEILANVEADFLITDRSLEDPVIVEAKSQGIDIVFVTDLFSKKSSHEVKLDTFGNDPKDLSMIFYTSGSTGVPKGVMIKNESFINNVENITQILNVEKRKFVDLHDVSFVISIPIIFPCILSRSELFSANSEADILFPGNVILRERVDTVITVPSTLKRIVFDRNSSSVMSTLKTVVSCGEPLAYDLLEAFIVNKQLSFFNFYGSTEVAPWIFFHKCTTATLKFRSMHNFVPIGSLLDGNEMEIDNDGMLLIRGCQITPGYIKHETNSHLVSYKHSLWLPMHDLVEKIDNIFFCKGRMDGVAKIKGFRVHLSDIEINMKKLQGVDECICFVEGEKITAHVFSKTINNKKIVFEKAKQILPNYMIPNTIILKKTAPINKNGKVDRAKIKSLI